MPEPTSTLEMLSGLQQMNRPPKLGPTLVTPTNQQIAPTQPSKPLSTSSLTSSVFSGNAEAKKVAFNRAATEKNPLALKSFAEQGASIQAKLLRLSNDPVYKKLSPADKVRVRSGIYDKFVAPSFAAAGHADSITKKQWLSGTKGTQVDRINQDDYFASKSINAAHDFAASAGAGAEKIMLAGLELTSRTLVDAYPLGKYFQSATKDRVTGEKIQEGVAVKYLNKAKQSLQEGLNQTNFFLATHPREGFLAAANRWSGENIVQLPIWEAAAGARAEIGFTDMLASSPVGKFALRRLGNAADGFIGSLATGGTKGEAVGTAIGGVVLGTAGEAISAATAPVREKIASAPLIKKWTANVIAMGGKPIAQELTHSAAAELTGEGHGIQASTTAFVGEHKLGDITVVPETEHKGFLIHEGTAHPFSSATERQEVYNKLAADAEAKRSATDPLLHKMHDAEKQAINSVATEMFNKPLSELSVIQKDKVIMRRLELIDEAAHELPVHVPDLNLAEVQHSNAQEAAGNPQFAKALARAKELFPNINTDQVVSDNQVNDISKQVGITNSEAAVKKVVRVKDALIKGQKKITPEAFASHRVDTLQYFRNPVGGERRDIAGNLIGMRDKRSWNERLKAENTKQFIETLKEADGNKIKFENPYHRMLFHWSNRDSLPTPVKDKLLREMKKISEIQGRGSMKVADFNAEADKALIHLHLLAKGGQLTSERNVFASTKTGAGAFSEWQLELQTEVAQQELKMLRAVTERHPAGRKVVLATIKMLQANRFTSNDPEQWLNYDRAINNFIANRGKIGN